MNTVTFDIQALISPDTNWVWGENMFAGKEPPKPNNTLTLFDTPGGGNFLGTKRDEDDPGSDAYEYTAFQIRIRNHDYNEGMKQARAIKNLLHGIGNTVVNETLYTVIEALDNPSLLDWDDNDRARIIVNFTAQRTPAAITFDTTFDSTFG